MNENIFVLSKSNEIKALPRAAFGKLPVVFEVNLFDNQISNIR